MARVIDFNLKVKTCTRCKSEKDVSDFYRLKTKTGKLSYQPNCKLCCGQATKDRYYKEKNKKYKPIKDLPTEIWKDILGWEGKYQISSCVRVKSVNRYVYSKKWNKMAFYPEKIMAQSDNCEGYMHVTFTDKSLSKRFKIHQLMAISFIPNPENKTHINHKNGIRNDNRIENLEWCTPQENMDHKYNVLGYVHPTGKENKLSIPIIVIYPDGTEEKIYGISEAARKLGIWNDPIRRVLSNKTKEYRGYKFKYA